MKLADFQSFDSTWKFYSARRFSSHQNEFFAQIPGEIPRLSDSLHFTYFLHHVKAKNRLRSHEVDVYVEKCALDKHRLITIIPNFSSHNIRFIFARQRKNFANWSSDGAETSRAGVENSSNSSLSLLLLSRHFVFRWRRELFLYLTFTHTFSAPSEKWKYQVVKTSFAQLIISYSVLKSISFVSQHRHSPLTSTVVAVAVHGMSSLCQKKKKTPAKRKSYESWAACGSRVTWHELIKQQF